MDKIKHVEFFVFVRLIETIVIIFFGILAWISNSIEYLVTLAHLAHLAILLLLSLLLYFAFLSLLFHFEWLRINLESSFLDGAKTWILFRVKTDVKHWNRHWPIWTPWLHHTTHRHSLGKHRLTVHWMVTHGHRRYGVIGAAHLVWRSRVVWLLVW